MLSDIKILFRLRFVMANSINTHLRLKTPDIQPKSESEIYDIFQLSNFMLFLIYLIKFMTIE